MEENGQLHAPAAKLSGKETRYPRRVGFRGARGWYGTFCSLSPNL